MSAGRPTLAGVIATELERGNFLGWLLAQGSSALWAHRTPEQEMARVVAPIAREHILGLLADETLVERCVEALLADADPLRLLSPSKEMRENARRDVRAVLAQVAEAVRDER